MCCSFGGTGSGKSTFAAAMIDQPQQHFGRHTSPSRGPVEYAHTL